ncbi:MAG TPA: hypothetical protein VIJ14_05075 [Rhabdochlamydiaceae bacterium]
MGDTAVEVVVIVKDDERTMRQKFLSYDSISLSYQDKVIQKCVRETLANFQGQPDDISIKFSMEWLG